MAALGEDREPRRAPAGVFEHAVAVAVGQPGRREQLARARAIVGARRRGGAVPAPVARRDRPVERHRRAEVHRVDDRLAIDAARDRLPELLARQPRRPPDGEARRPQVERQEIGVEADAPFDHAQAALVGEPLERGVVLRPDVAVAHQIGLAGFEAQRLGVLVGHDGEREAIEVRQLDAAGVAAEVVRVAREDEPLPGDVLGEHERAEAGDVGERLRRRPRRSANSPAVERRFELVPREDRQAVEQPQPGANGSGNRTTTVRASGADTSSGLPSTCRAEASGLCHARVVRGAEREEHVGGGERLAVGEAAVPR